MPDTDEDSMPDGWEVLYSLDPLVDGGSANSDKAYLDVFQNDPNKMKNRRKTMETIGAYEAKTHLPKLLERVIRGEHITITKHGVPVAMLVPPPPLMKMETKQVIDELRMFQKKHKLGGIPILDMIAEGRK
jgi:prevent-host-death family protein